MGICKKALSMIFVFLIILKISSPVFASSIETEEIVNSEATSLEEIDVLLVAGSILNSPSPENDILVSDSTTPNETVPLYSESGKIIAYYASFEPTGYAIVNNNSSNPTVIEFGEGGHPLIEDILSINANARIIYNNPTEVYTANTQTTYMHPTPNGECKVDLYSYFPALNEENEYAASQLNQLRQVAIPENSVYGTGGYGFLDWDQLPSGNCISDSITKATSTTWATTGAFDSIATNHCGAVAVTNLALYFANCGYSDLKKDTIYNTFVEVHEIVGNGPVMTIADEAKDYFSNCGYTLKSSSANNFSNIIAATTNDHPCGVLLANGIVDWHWIICVGYCTYESGSNYMRVVDGWYQPLRYYLIHSGSMWWSATEYWVE